MDIILVLTNLAFVAGFFFCLLQKLDGLRSDIHADTRDFHGRLCRIEESKKNIKK